MSDVAPDLAISTGKQRGFAALIVMACTLGTRLLGFVRSAVINAIFGASGQADVLNAVFSIPNNLRKLMAEGALTSAFIPELSRKIVHDDRPGARNLTRETLGFQYLVLIPVTLVCVLLSFRVIHAFVHFSDPAKTALASGLFKYFFPYVILVSVSAIMMAALNCHHKFFVSALSPLLFSIAVIGSVLTLHGRLGVYAMAVGVLIGGVLQIVVQYPSFKRAGYALFPRFKFTDPAFRKVLRHWAPALATSGVFAINQQVAVLLASSLADGSSSAFSNAIVFFQLPFGIFSAAVNTVFFPQMSRAAGRRDYVALNERMVQGMNMLAAFLIPSSVLLIALGAPLIAVAFMRGAFRSEDAVLAARTLTGFCFGMLFTAAYNFMQRFFYARGVFRAPFISALIACSLDVIISLVLIRTPLGVSGLAYANSAAFLISLLLLIVFSRMQYGEIGMSAAIKPIMKILLCSLGSVGAYFLTRRFLGIDWWRTGSSWANFGRLCIFGFAMLIPIVAGYAAFKLNPIGELRKRKK